MEGMSESIFKLIFKAYQRFYGILRIFTVDYFIFMYLPGQCNKYQTLNVLFKIFKNVCLELILMDLYIECLLFWTCVFYFLFQIVAASPFSKQLVKKDGKPAGEGKIFVRGLFNSSLR